MLFLSLPEPLSKNLPFNLEKKYPGLHLLGGVLFSVDSSNAMSDALVIPSWLLPLLLISPASTLAVASLIIDSNESYSSEVDTSRRFACSCVDDGRGDEDALRPWSWLTS